jgi:hypothetical protein
MSHRLRTVGVMGELSFPVLPDVSSAALDQLPIERLEAELTGLAAQSAAAMCRWLVMVAEFDRRDAAARWWGVRSTAHWLEWQCALEERTARAHVAVARRIVGLPKTMAAFASGALSYSKVRALVRVATISTEDTWIEKARQATAAQLEDAVRGYRQAIGADDPAPAVDPAEERGELYESWTEEGRGHLRANLRADDFALALAAIDKRADELFQEQAKSGPAGPLLCRTRAELRAQAMVELLCGENGCVCGGDGSDDRHLVVIVAEASSLDPEGHAYIEGGPPVSAERLAELLCDQPLALLVKDDSGNPLYLGRSTKQLNRRQRRALRYRDGRCCQFPGCKSTKRINGHHVAWWARDHGPTDIDNLVSLCPFHHRLIHQQKFFIKVDADGRFVFTRSDGAVLENSPPPPPVQTTIEQANAALGTAVASAPEPGEGYPQDLALTVDHLLWKFGLAY